MKEKNLVEDFYQAVATLLEFENHSYIRPVPKKNRWNNRHPGNGRFVNHGLVRYFGPSYIHINLHSPPVHGLFSNVEDALEAIQLGVSYETEEFSCQSCQKTGSIS